MNELLFMLSALGILMGALAVMLSPNLVGWTMEKAVHWWISGGKP